MPLSSIIKQTEEVLDEVIRIIRQEHDNPYPVLCETDRDMFVKEEKSLREQLKEAIEAESNTSRWSSLLGRSSPQAVKCLKTSEELRKRVKEDINAKVRTRLSGKSNPSPSFTHGRGFETSNSIGASTPTVTSPLNMSCSSPENSELIVYPITRNDNIPLEASSDRSRNSSTQRMAQSSNSSLSSETTSTSNGSCRSHSGRRPTPPPVSRIVEENEGSSREERRRSDDYTTMTNCVDINGSNVNGMTLNNGGCKNTGSVIHQTTSPRSSPYGQF